MRRPNSFCNLADEMAEDASIHPKCQPLNQRRLEVGERGEISS